jgi:UDP-2,3-diacylglucosamine pyrophosphatase LpxH
VWSRRLVGIYVLSDLHLDERGEARMFSDERQGRELSALCERVARDEGAELLLLGDTFDFTAMQPPPKGLRDFFRALDVPHEEPRRRDLHDLLAAVRESNPVAFEALSRLTESAPVTFVPGNHDFQLGEPGASDVLAAVGLRARLERSAIRRIAGRTVVLQHGHELDEGNAQPGGSGEVMTNALHQAVIPFLRHHGAPANVRVDPDRLVALRPEEAIVSVLQRWLDQKTFRRFFRAFLRLLAQNGYLPRPLSWLAGLVSADRVRSAVAEEDRLWERTGQHAIEVLKGKGQLPHGAPLPDVAVLGHTHVLDWAVERGRLYVNLGTWTERAFDASSPRDVSLPVLHVEDAGGRLRASLIDLSAADAELQRYDA